MAVPPLPSPAGLRLRCLGCCSARYPLDGCLLSGWLSSQWMGFFSVDGCLLSVLLQGVSGGDKVVAFLVSGVWKRSERGEDIREDDHFGLWKGNLDSSDIADRPLVFRKREPRFQPKSVSRPLLSTEGIREDDPLGLSKGNLNSSRSRRPRRPLLYSCRDVSYVPATVVEV